MVQPAKNILFISDLTTNMKLVFEQAVTLATCQETEIIVLHVMEEDPSSEKRIRMAFGEQLYEDLKSEQKNSTRNILIGKNIDALKIRQAITGFFENVAPDQKSNQNNSLIKKTLVAEGRSIIDEIISTITEENCDMIVMGCRQQGLLSEAMGDKLVRKVLKRSSVPVMVVPFAE
jgi:nucleotide-binding universal stress UspA family protein